MSEWDIYVTDHGPEHTQTPRFVVRAKRIGDAVIVYGTGSTELEARQDAYDQMTEKDQAAEP
jgi:hypothetical protein